MLREGENRRRCHEGETELLRRHIPAHSLLLLSSPQTCQHHWRLPVSFLFLQTSLQIVSLHMRRHGSLFYGICHMSCQPFHAAAAWENAKVKRAMLKATPSHHSPPFSRDMREEPFRRASHGDISRGITACLSRAEAEKNRAMPPTSPLPHHAASPLHFNCFSLPPHHCHSSSLVTKIYSSHHTQMSLAYTRFERMAIHTHAETGLSMEIHATYMPREPHSSR